MDYEINESSGNLQDSTANNFDTTRKSASEPSYTSSGKIDGAQYYDGNDDYVNVSDNNLLDVNNFTVETWVKADTTNQLACAKAINKQKITGQCGGTYPYSLQDDCMVGNGKIWAYTYTDSIKETKGPNWSTNWMHIVMTYDNSNLILYINGSQYNSTSSTVALCANTNPLVIGGRTDSAQSFDGIIDEARLSNTSRSASWINASYLIMSDEFITYGSEETTRAITISCGSMNENDFCQLNWTINATGDYVNEWKIGVLFNSSSGSVTDNHTDNATIKIIECNEAFTIRWNKIDFSNLNPNTDDNKATGNDNYTYNISNTGTCTLEVWIKGTDLTNTTTRTPSTLNHTINVGNITWSNTTNISTSGYTMTKNYVILNSSFDQTLFKNITTYYWISVPPIPAGKYNGTITYCANTTQQSGELGSC